MEIRNNIAVVTGGGSGLGKATVEYLETVGAKVIVLDIQSNDDRTLICDVSNNDSVESSFKTIQSKWGSPRICVNCAGILGAGKVIGKKGPMDPGFFQQVMNINLIGTFNVLRSAAAIMHALPTVGETGERGVIINTASIAAFEGQIGQAAYSASKGGIVSMTLPLAREFADKGIRVMAIAPGLMETPMLSTINETVKTQLKESLVFPKRLGMPEEFAKLVGSIIENPLLNGGVIRLDGAVRLV